MELAIVHPSDTYNFEVAPTFLENLWASGDLYRIMSASILSMYLSEFLPFAYRDEVFLLWFITYLVCMLQWDHHQGAPSSLPSTTLSHFSVLSVHRGSARLL